MKKLLTNYLLNITLLISLFTSISCSAVELKVYNFEIKEFINYNNFINELPNSGHIVMGEYHNQQLIQNAQSQIINDYVLTRNMQGQFNIMWEFLNYTNQEAISTSFNDFILGNINVFEFITFIAGDRNFTYAPMLESAKNLEGKIIGINIPRKYKQQLIDGGLRSVDPIFIPPNIDISGDDYLKRFTAVMAGHVPPEKIEKYFQAQCYTDSVMSYQISKNSNKLINFIIAGSFHTDYFDGTVIRLKKLREDDVVTLKIIDANQTTPEEIKELLTPSSEYGTIADYLIISK
jgi:uncharacterized iron-regulated protein